MKFYLVFAFAVKLSIILPLIDGLDVIFKIAGGADASIETFPYQVFVSHLNHHHCGGAVINKNVILTAAHCVASVNKEDLVVRAGVSDVSKSGGITRNVSQIVVHEEYDDQEVKNDIAIMFISPQLVYSDSIKPIALPKFREEFQPGTKAYMTGWGLVGENEPFPDVLQYVETFIISQEDCTSQYDKVNILKSMICAGRKDKGHPCSSDSGGPLVVMDDNEHPKLVGILSFGFKCSKTGPRIYSKVSAYREWIDRNI